MQKLSIVLEYIKTPKGILSILFISIGVFLAISSGAFKNDTWIQIVQAVIGCLIGVFGLFIALGSIGSD